MIARQHKSRHAHSRYTTVSTKTPVVASIESPQALLNLGEIAAWKGRALELVGLMVSVQLTISHASFAADLSCLLVSLQPRTVSI